MRHLILFSTILFFCFRLHAQTGNDKVVFYNADWEECSKDSASYYRIIKDYNVRQETYKVKDYYITGELQMEGDFLDPDVNLKEGRFRWFYKNGNQKEEAYYQKDRRRRDYRTWYENGKEKLVGEYLKNKSNKLWEVAIENRFIL